jgi:hypothetical protein
MEYDAVMEETLTNKQHDTYDLNHAVPCFSFILRYISPLFHPLRRRDKVPMQACILYRVASYAHIPGTEHIPRHTTHNTDHCDSANRGHRHHRVEYQIFKKIRKPHECTSSEPTRQQ